MSFKCSKSWITAECSGSWISTCKVFGWNSAALLNKNWKWWTLKTMQITLNHNCCSRGLSKKCNFVTFLWIFQNVWALLTWKNSSIAFNAAPWSNGDCDKWKICAKLVFCTIGKEDLCNLATEVSKFMVNWAICKSVSLSNGCNSTKTWNENNDLQLYLLN